jgi:uncharacterized repeat protein (TIGR01451 family)
MVVGLFCVSSGIAYAAGGVVTTCATSGAGSLSEVISKVSPGATVTFSVTCPSGSPITLASAIDIDKNLTIEGPGSGSMVVSGNGSTQIFDIAASSAEVFISGLTIESGYATNGGAIFNKGTLNVGRSTLEDNTATENGGGVYNADGIVSLIDCEVSNNTALQENSISDEGGGGVYNFGILKIKRSDFSHNSTTEGGGAIDDLGELTISDSTFSDNSAVYTGGAVLSASSLTVSGSIFNGNTDSGGGDGAIDVGGDATISDSTISNNSSMSGEFTAFGGGIGVDEGGGDLTLMTSTVFGNYSQFAGGGVSNLGMAVIVDSTISDNTAGYGGGGIFNDNVSRVVDSTIDGNIADGDAGSGGGVWARNSYDGGSGVVALEGSIVSDSGVARDCSGGIQDRGYNLSDDDSCSFSSTDNSIVGESPGLSPLADNGGSTETQALGPSSPAIGQIPLGTDADWAATPELPEIPICPSSDQRGVDRPQVGQMCDIGSNEYGDVAIQSLATSSSKVAKGSKLTYVATVANAGSSAATGVTLTDVTPASEKFESVSTSAGTCSHSGGTVHCKIANMAAATTGTVEIVVKITASTGKISNTAVVGAATGDTISSNDSKTATVKLK